MRRLPQSSTPRSIASRVAIKASTSSINPSLELTLNSSLESVATAQGDSFVADFGADRSLEDPSFEEDPYLIPKERILANLRRRQAAMKERRRARECVQSKKELDRFFPSPTSMTVDSDDDSGIQSAGSFLERPDHPQILSLPPRARFVETDEVSVPSQPSFASDAALHVESRAELDAWQAAVERRLAACGVASRSTAEALVNLGRLRLAAAEYTEAQKAFQLAYRVYAKGNRPLGTASAMIGVGEAASREAAELVEPDRTEAMQRAYTVLLEAFRLRQRHLGSHHPDTVDCLNLIARLHVVYGDHVEAQRCYWQVYWVRLAIFGPRHPSPAVAAHALANVFYHCSALEDASNFYQIAMEVYDTMNLPSENPAVKRLIADMKRLERVQRSV